MPVRAVIFDLDGTLVRTEDLKGLSYARAAVQLRPDLSEDQVIEAYKEVVGLPRETVSRALVEQFQLAETAGKQRETTDAFWEEFAARRLDIYRGFLGDRTLLKEFECPYNVGLLEDARQRNLNTGLATMSHKNEAFRVLDLLEISSKFDSIATRDDVLRGKPDPEIYLLSARRLQTEPAECLVIEDSPAGIAAALAAGMRCIAVTTNLTRTRVHESKLLDSSFIVDDPQQLLTVVGSLIDGAEETNRLSTKLFRNV